MSNTSTTNNNQPLPARRPLEPQLRAIVIGASSGIGAALVRELVQKKYIVAALARRESELTQVCEQANKPGGPGRAVPYVHDVTHYAEVPALFQQITQEIGGLDLIIYNAGVMPPVSPTEFDFAKDQQQIEINLLGAMAWLNCAANRFRVAQSGRIVGISSVAGDRGRRMNPAYHTSKGALSIYLESLRNRLSQFGVTVTTIKPGFVDTVMLANAPKTFWVISPTQAAKNIIEASEKGKQVVYVPGRWALVMLIIRHIPSFIFRRLSI